MTADQAGIATCVFGLVVALGLIHAANKSSEDIRWTGAFFFPFPAAMLWAALMNWVTR